MGREFIEDVDYPSQKTLSAWPNCSVPDCEYKANLPLDKCYPHSQGRNPSTSYEEYMNAEVADDTED